ncbi:amidohydrolase 2 [Pluteus cervinus]|uniref:Amidohydrolase 2 n=1 Tax=Pluteus cervinus TaxID=181527 RepID=A0ACD3BCN1_9AGAR|nr:amidohydrolase 2 [Pluteus cervinus]
MVCIDVHHHFFPLSLQKDKPKADLGWRTPAENLPWTPELSVKAMDDLGIDMAILSLPAIPSGEISQENRSLARERNLYLFEVCKTYPRRYGFFACIPFLHDIEGVLAEIAYAFDELNADGISLASSYGEGPEAVYIGDERFDPIWAALHHRKAVVFLHGTQTPCSTPIPHPFLGVPITEVPNETFKAAAHLVVSGRKRKYPDVKVILAHMGGTLPSLAPRIAALSSYMGCPLTPEEILDDFRSFYFDTALSSHEVTLTAINNFVEPNRVLFGSDFPAVNRETVNWYTKQLRQYAAGEEEKLDGIFCKNALELFPRLRNLIVDA